MKETMEIRFNGIYNKVIPLILFSPKKKRDTYVDLLSGLFDAMIARDYDVFERVYKKLNSLVQLRDIYDSKKESLINNFLDMHKSLDEKIKEHDEVIIEMKKHIKKIKNNRKLINNHYQEFKKMQKPVKIDKEIMKKSIGKSNNNVSNRNCPVESCDGHLFSKGSHSGIKRFQCNTCHKGFPKKDDGEYYYCDTCGNLLTGYGAVVSCIKCGEKNRIVCKPKKGKYKLKCPYCGYVWWYTGKRGINGSGRITCPDSVCRRSFSLKNKHILKDNTGDGNVQNDS